MKYWGLGSATHSAMFRKGACREYGGAMYTQSAVGLLLGLSTSQCLKEGVPLKSTSIRSASRACGFRVSFFALRVRGLGLFLGRMSRAPPKLHTICVYMNKVSGTVVAEYWIFLLCFSKCDRACQHLLYPDSSPFSSCFWTCSPNMLDMMLMGRFYTTLGMHGVSPKGSCR